MAPSSSATRSDLSEARGLRRWLAWRPTLSVEAVALLAALYWAFTANVGFVRAALRGRETGEAGTWVFAVVLVLMVVALHTFLLLLVAQRRTVKPLVALLAVIAALATYYMGAFGVYMDPSMLRNVFRTNPAEAGELIGPPMLLHLALFAGLPMLVLWRIHVSDRPWGRAWWVRLLWLVGSVLALVGLLLSIFQPFSSLMRNHKEMRYLITPANLLWSSSVVAADEWRGAAKPKAAIGLDAKPGPSWAQRRKPLVVVLVVGETARAANWGLSGYARQTTPELAKLPVVNFPDVSACGTNTETSLPCLFAPIGRRDYNESRIRGQEGLLQVVARAGVGVNWRDNQSGCKGVCDGLPSVTVTPAMAPALCPDGRCLDEALVQDMTQRLQQASGTQLWVLHMIGSHGPSYYRRYPPAFARFQPACRFDDLQRCGVPEIVNAYDNTILYTDHVVATAVRDLLAQQDRVDSALLYVSDHGESLGEHGLFLHGMPMAIAPAVQTKVPMVMWGSAGLEQAVGLRSGCLAGEWARRAKGPVTHDNVFHTVLGLLDVRTSLFEPALDLSGACR